MSLQCKLCLDVVDKLEDSHYLPSALYKLMRDEDSGNPNPFLVAEDVSVQTSKQMKAHLLCHSCEERLNKNGESWVLKNGLQKNGGFPIAQTLLKKEPIGSRQDISLHFANVIKEIDIEKLVYFGASIFWRGSIYAWDRNGSVPIRLGKYQEEIRKFLMGETAFPLNCALSVTISELSELNRITGVPISYKQPDCYGHNFMMPGIAFILYAGNTMHEMTRKLCILRGLNNPIFVSPKFDRKKVAAAKEVISLFEKRHD